MWPETLSTCCWADLRDSSLAEASPLDANVAAEHYRDYTVSIKTAMEKEWKWLKKKSI